MSQLEIFFLISSLKTSESMILNVKIDNRIRPSDVPTKSVCDLCIDVEISS